MKIKCMKLKKNEYVTIRNSKYNQIKLTYFIKLMSFFLLFYNSVKELNLFTRIIF